MQTNPKLKWRNLQDYNSIEMKQGHPVVSELEFAAEKIPKDVKVIAVTGTNGKSTVTTFSGQVSYLLGIT